MRPATSDDPSTLPMKAGSVVRPARGVNGTGTASPPRLVGWPDGLCWKSLGPRLRGDERRLDAALDEVHGEQHAHARHQGQAQAGQHIDVAGAPVRLDQL